MISAHIFSRLPDPGKDERNFKRPKVEAAAEIPTAPAGTPTAPEPQSPTFKKIYANKQLQTYMGNRSNILCSYRRCLLSVFMSSELTAPNVLPPVWGNLIEYPLTIERDREAVLSNKVTLSKVEQKELDFLRKYIIAFEVHKTNCRFSVCYFLQHS